MQAIVTDLFNRRGCLKRAPSIHLCHDILPLEVQGLRSFLDLWNPLTMCYISLLVTCFQAIFYSIAIMRYRSLLLILYSVPFSVNLESHGCDFLQFCDPQTYYIFYSERFNGLIINNLERVQKKG